MPDPDDVPMPRRWSNRAVALTVLGVMLTVGLSGLVFALQTVGFREANHQRILKPEVVTVPILVRIAGALWFLGLVVLLYDWWKKRMEGLGAGASVRMFRVAVGAGAVILALSLTVTLVLGTVRKRSSQLPGAGDLGPVRARAPASLDGLRYLPADLNLIAAIHVADLLRQPDQRELLTSLRFGPLAVEHIRRTTGLAWDDIDHLVIGMKVDERFPPRTLLIARTRRPLDAQTLLVGLQATPLADGARADAGKPRYRIEAPRPIFEAFLCFEDPRTLVLALSARDLELAEEHPGIDHLAAPMQELIEQRIDRSASAWLVGRLERWDKTIVQPWLITLPAGERERVEQVKSFAVWLRHEQQIVLGAALESADEKSATAWRTWFEEWAKPRFADLKVFQDGAWLVGQAKAESQTVLELLGAPAPDRQPK